MNRRKAKMEWKGKDKEKVGDEGGRKGLMGDGRREGGREGRREGKKEVSCTALCAG